ncbi:MAG: Bax inhibitor-1/YccA family protein [Bdellovibrionales bacterium]|nr:Bax inhibitor-1/YccA family protein [Bdellovibrionales bacterium]
MRTSNPALNDRVFRSLPSAATDDIMTVDGTINKTFICLGLAFLTAYWSWGNPQLMGLYIPLVIVTLIAAIALSFKPAWSPYLAPAYALGEGVILGSVSSIFELQFPGIVAKAVFITFAVLLCMLYAYKSKWIVVSDKLRSIISVGIGAIFLVYLVTFILGLFGVNMSFMHDSSPLSIGISILVTGFAAASLLLDFDFIENASNRRNTPKYMEWYGAFGLLVSLVWLYFEILRLLSKLQSRNN